MDLQILISKKGTKVVTASNLYLVLELPQSQYGKQIKRWITDTYEFHDGIRRPERMKDYAKRQVPGSPVPDYYLSVELAKLISLRSNSKRKLRFARELHTLEDHAASDGRLSPEQVLAMVELTRVMGLVSCQTASEQRHLKTYEERNGGKANAWWKFRSRLLGYSNDKLQEQMRSIGKSARGKNQREMLMQIDKHEMIRTGVIDLFMSIGKPAQYARRLGDLAKGLARELNVEIFDDRDEAPRSWLPEVNTQLAGEVRNARNGQYLSLWQNG